MMHILKTFLFLSILLFPFFRVGAVTFDWSGWSRLEAYYQNDQKYYSDWAFVLNSKLYIKDGIRFNFRLDLIDFEGDWDKLWKNPYWTKNLYHQRGYVFLYKDSQAKKKNFPFVLPSQFYFDYQSEFFKFRAGRAPYHFGLGANYLATQDPFSLWLSVPDQISVYMEYRFLSFQPSLFHYFSEGENRFSGLLQAGLSQEDWEILALYEQPLNEDSPWIELYGEYKQELWSVRLSGTYIIENQTSFSVLLESLYRLNRPSAIDLKLKAGWLTGSAKLHPGYNIGLLLAHRQILPESESDYQIAQGRLEDIVYLGPQASFYLFEKSLKLEPLFLLAYHDDKLHYEGDFYGRYQFNETLFFDLKAGALYQEDWSFALLAQAAVSF